MNIKGLLYPRWLESLDTFPVVGLVEPRQIGKTALAKQLAASLLHSGQSTIMLDLERPSDLAKLNEPELLLAPLAEHLVILDEVQLKPNLFSVLRSLLDEQRRPGRF